LIKNNPFHFLLFIISPLLLAHLPEKSKPTWKQYYRCGIVNNVSSFGVSNYARLKRTTQTNYHDIRFFGNFFENNTNLVLRQKSSRKLLSLDKFYSFNTLLLEKNTLSDIHIRYHSNQGFGLFVKDMDIIDLNIELGIAFDNSDYLNTQKKTSYFKAGSFIDVKLSPAKLKFELEYFKQVQIELEKDNLSRINFLGEFIIPLKKNISLTLGLINQSYSENIFKHENNLIFANFSFSKHLGWEF
tara:strand:- start:1779 stop:2507 length:729 start_codon:yes stop_codon:yes gene_type:complete